MEDPLRKHEETSKLQRCEAPRSDFNIPNSANKRMEVLEGLSAYHMQSLRKRLEIQE